MSKEDSITIEVGDENEPNIRLPDTEIGESLKRLCTNDEIKKCLYDAVNNHKKMSRAPWKYYAIQGIMITIATASAAVLSTVIGRVFL